MPWMESTVMEERLRFVARRLEGEGMTALCREFGISRKTGHKLFARYKDHGLEALADRPRRPGRVANRLPMPVEAAIVGLRREHPGWGARKLGKRLSRACGKDVRCRRRSTIHAVLDRHGLVEHARARRPRAAGTPLSAGASQRALVLRLQGRVPSRQWPRPCHPDGHRPGLALSSAVRGLEGTAEAPVFTAFHRLFQERGLPVAIRSDNGVPFASRSLYGLSRLSVWSAPAGHPHRADHPRQAAAERPPRAHAPHPEAGDIRPAARNSSRSKAASTPSSPSSTPSARTRRSPCRPRPALCRLAAALRRPARARLSVPRPRASASDSGAVALHGHAVFISWSSAARSSACARSTTTFGSSASCTTDLGYIDLEDCKLQTIDTPFGSRVSPM